MIFLRIDATQPGSVHYLAEAIVDAVSGKEPTPSASAPSWVTPRMADAFIADSIRYFDDGVHPNCFFECQRQYEPWQLAPRELAHREVFPADEFGG